MCQRASHGQGCPVPGSCSVVPVERAILTWCSDQMNLTSLTEGGPDLQGPRARLAGLQQEIANTERQIERITEALLADDGPTPVSFARRARELEQQLAGLQAEVTATEQALAAATHHTPALASQWADLAERAMAMDHEARLQVRALVHDTFQRITIFHSGSAFDDATTARPISVQLTSRSGATRVLVIDRRTGELVRDHATAEAGRARLMPWPEGQG